MLYQVPIFRVLLAVFLVWGALFYGSIESTVAIWYRSETFAHCFIILPICIYLIKQKWALLKGTPITPFYPALVFVLGTLLLWVFGVLAQLLVIEQAAAFLMLPLGIWLVAGNAVARVLLFTMAFWLFSVPVGEFLIPQLQELTADITVWALRLTGIPVYREGLYIAIPGGLFEVAVACSGIRYLIASFTLGALYAYLNYSAFKKRAIFVVFSIALPLLANGIRAYGIVMIAHLSDMKYATGVDHLIYGWLFFGVVIAIMFSVGNIWAEAPEKHEDAPATEMSGALAKKLVSASAVFILTVGLARGYMSLVENPEVTTTPDYQSITEFTPTTSEDSWLPVFEGATDLVTGTTGSTDIVVAYYPGNTQGQELINAQNKVFNEDAWSIVRGGARNGYQWLEITSLAGQRRMVSYTYATDWLVSPSAVKVKLSQAVQAFLGEPQTGLAVVLSASVDELADKEAFLVTSDEILVSSLSSAVNNGR